MFRFSSPVLFCLLLHAGVFAQHQQAGDLAARIDLVFNRFHNIAEPAFSDDFILADVKLDPAYPRRFDEFSGDISGRFLGAVALMSRGAEDDAQLHRLVAELLKYQREDGRFGYANLSFNAVDVGPDQMALLWGNGRLLVGLLEYYQRFPEQKEVLDASIRLGDFLLQVFNDCATPEVRERVRGKAANGFICFTQFNEGLELLCRATGNTKYRDAARQMESLLEPRGVQHTHGYLTTLRGHMMIFESTKEPELLATVEARFQDLLDSGSVMINGGLLEYFKADYDRDEGCTEADFLRLCLQLYKATGIETYMAHAERCLYNSLYANQWETGDFGHRCFDGRGYMPHQGAARAWWCCTMHGLRAFRDVLDTVVTPKSEYPKDDGQPGIRINLLKEGRWSASDMALRIERIPESGLAYRITVEQAPETFQTLAVRIPNWADMTTKKVITNGQEVSSSGERTASCNETEAPLIREYGRCTGHGRNWKTGDMMEIYLECAPHFVNRQNQVFRADELPAGAPVEMAIFYGPWLLGVNAFTNPMFHGEPYADNVLLIPEEETLKASIAYDTAAGPLLNGPRLRLEYEHSGFPGIHTVTLQPVGEQATHTQTTVTYWHQVKRAS